MIIEAVNKLSDLKVLNRITGAVRTEHQQLPLLDFFQKFVQPVEKIRIIFSNRPGNRLFGKGHIQKDQPKQYAVHGLSILAVRSFRL